VDCGPERAERLTGAVRQASAGTPKNTREPARSGKKKPQPRTVGLSLLVSRAGVEPATNGLKVASERFLGEGIFTFS
jgi:hypothetical protein